MEYFLVYEILISTFKIDNKRINNLNMKILVSFCLIFITSFAAIAQTESLSGVVKNQDNEPVPFVAVSVEPIKRNTTTNENGAFNFSPLAHGDYTIHVMALGYKNYVAQISIDHDEHKQIEIILTKSSIQLSEVEIFDNTSALTSRTPYNLTKMEVETRFDLKGNPSGLMGFIQENAGISGAEMGPGIVKPFIRGLGFSRIVTIYQGNKFENHQWGADHGLGLNDLGVKNVEVIKGPASILYGSGALGGVILVKDYDEYLNTNQLVGNAGFTFNTNSGGYRPYFSIGKQFENGLFFAVDAAYENHADYTDGSGRTIGNSRFNTEAVRLHTGINKKNFKGKISYTYFKQNLGIIEDDEMDDEESLATARWDREMQLPFQDVTDHVISYNQTTIHNKFTTVFQLSHHLNLRKEIEDDFDDIDLGLIQNHTFLNARVAHRTTDRLENILGIQGSYINMKNMDDAEEILIPDATSIEAGIYYLANYTISENYFLQGGLRYDYRDVTADASAPNLINYGFILFGEPQNRRLSTNFSGLTSSLGLTRSLKNKGNIKLNLATGFRAPDLAELFSNGPHPGTNRFEIGNANFTREQSFQIDISTNYQFTQALSVSFAAFNNYIENYIFFAGTGEIRPDSGLENWEFRQTNANLYGGEASVIYSPKFLTGLVINVDASIVRGRDLENNENLTFIPADNILARATYHLFKNRTKVFAALRFVDRQNLPGFGEEITPTYSLLSAGINHEFKLNANKQSLNVGITGFNLLNRNYFDHLSILRAFEVTNPGRNFMINAQYKF
jgi:iron complex outermembrane receptor protein